MSIRAQSAFEERLPDEMEAQSANSLRRILARHQPDEERPATLNIHGEEPIEIAPAVAKTLLEALRIVASGQGVRIIPVGAELTTQEAADILNMSRPSLIKLLEAGEIDFTKTGRHRRIRAEDVFAYKDRRDGHRRKILKEMIEADEEAGLI